ncbi:MAG TPA: N-acetyltransferase [Levilinea sp.]|nr:N-acetyltransferase [Levilinea sp.]
MVYIKNIKHICLRPLDVRKDLLSVAELIELCFSNQMDPDGREYVRQIRLAGRDARYVRWIPGSHEHISFPLNGYVWEQDNRIVGNLSLIPFYRQGVWRYLIANVAVHPDYRRMGIGQALTKKALEHIEEQGVSAAWLQVRADNAAAQQLYRQLGFEERSRRSTWQCSSQNSLPPSPTAISITNRTRQDWPQQETWLQENYPPSVTWNLPFQISDLKPGFWPWARRVLSGKPAHHWAARRSDRLAATLTWEQSLQYIDYLWLAAPHDDDEAVQALLIQARRRFPFSRQLSLNYPAGVAAPAFENSGFRLYNTLIWMSVEFKV